MAIIMHSDKGRTLVEYRCPYFSRLLITVAMMQIGLVASGFAFSDSVQEEAAHDGEWVIDFTQSEFPLPYRAVNDNVMGGISSGSFILISGVGGMFSGRLSLENNGGFSSVRFIVPECIGGVIS